MKHLTTCPVCKNEKINEFLIVKDHFLSKEEFTIFKCDLCEFLFTNPKPDPNELLNYYKSDDYVSHGKSKSLIIKLIYNTVRNYSLNKKHQLVDNHSFGHSILDVGCGTGDFLFYFKRKGWDTLGIEPATEPRHYGREKFNLVIEDESYLDLISLGSFDVVTMWHVLEHVSDIDQRIIQIKRILKNDGLLVFALPNYQSWDSKHYHSFWAAWDVPRHLSHFSQKSFQTLIQNHNLEIIKTVPMKFDSFYVSLLSEKYSGSLFSFWNALKNGLKSNYYAKKHFNNYSSLIYLVKKRLIEN